MWKLANLASDTHLNARVVWLGITMVLSIILAGCVSAGPVALNQPISGEPVKLGRIHITRVDGSKISLDAASLKSDSIFGRERLGKGPRAEFRETAIPLSNVQSVEREGMSTSGTLVMVVVLFLAAGVLTGGFGAGGYNTL